jgi:hypothetical protein
LAEVDTDHVAGRVIFGNDQTRIERTPATPPPGMKTFLNLCCGALGVALLGAVIGVGAETTPQTVPQQTNVQHIQPPSPNPDPAPVAANQSKADPQTDLKNVILDMARLTRECDILGLVKTYTQPAIWAKLGPQYIQQYDAVEKQRQVQFTQYPGAEQQYHQTMEQLAAAYEALENQTPTFNGKGDEATYIYSLGGAI